MPVTDGPLSREVVLDERNQRVKVFEPRPAELSGELAFAPALLEEERPLFTKLIVYARPGDEAEWLGRGLRREAVVRGFFVDAEDAWLWAAYAGEDRANDPEEAALDSKLGIALARAPAPPSLPFDCTCRPAGPADAAELATLLADTFPDYPTPITGKGLAESIARGTSRFRIVHGEDGRLLSTASAEVDVVRRTAEMTDCATLPGERGRGLVAWTLSALERDLARDDITALYTIARAGEVGMNCAFRKLGYDYTGRLVKNCRMPEGWESMNVWCKKGGA